MKNQTNSIIGITAFIGIIVFLALFNLTPNRETEKGPTLKKLATHFLSFI
jgi:hypothetical protein